MSEAFEKRDLNIRQVILFGAGFAASILALGLITAWFYRMTPAGKAGPRPYPLNAFPEPRLETQPAESLKALRASEDILLNGYDWVDREKGIVRIPIERAMDLTAKKGLPHR